MPLSFIIALAYCHGYKLESESMDKIYVAVAQVASVFADKDACIAKAVEVINKAGAQGADLILLPEAMIPGYPRGFTYGAYIGNRTSAGRADFARYWKASLTVNDAETRSLREAARRRAPTLLSASRSEARLATAARCSTRCSTWDPMAIFSARIAS